MLSRYCTASASTSTSFQRLRSSSHVRRTLLQCSRYQSGLSSPNDGGEPPHAFVRPLVVEGLEKGEELEGTMCLVMNREKARNALSRRMVREMREGIRNVSTSKRARVLLLHTPYQGMFCAGADLKERAGMKTRSEVIDFLDSLNALMEEMEGLRIPTIAVVDGFALGGGTELALSCDMRVGGPGTKFALPETKLGIIPGAGGTQRLTKLVGVSKAKELIFTGRNVEGIEAERLGLLNLLAREPHSAMDAAISLARQILTSAPLALGAAKDAINVAPYRTLHQGLQEEREAYKTLLDTEDRQEGLRAFKEKRRPQFVGK